MFRYQNGPLNEECSPLGAGAGAGAGLPGPAAQPANILIPMRSTVSTIRLDWHPLDGAGACQPGHPTG